jgi:hypothetical protein
VKNLVLIEELYRFRRVSFYTARFDDEELSETAKFIERIVDTPELEREYGEEMRMILKIFGLMGASRGARPEYFRQERAVEALPPPRGVVQIREFERDNRLRLYCMRLSDEAVILFGGGIKTAPTVQDSPDVRMHFQLAHRIAPAINEALREGSLRLVGSDILGDDNERLLYL